MTTEGGYKNEPMEYYDASDEVAKTGIHQITISGGSSALDFSLVCKYCNGKYLAPTKSALRKHVSRFHKQEHVKYTKGAENPIMNNIFPCNQCDYKGPSRGALRQHKFRNHNK